VVASVLGASVALAVVHTAFESFSKSGDTKPQKTEALPHPEQGEKRTGNLNIFILHQGSSLSSPCNFPTHASFPWFRRKVEGRAVADKRGT